ncbi:MAG: biliverdin-producing heme oxygenase [Sphingobacteriales bacterium]|nr:MAG: biliverdin-producing heme oxygenase [Sphingobacteriales bacterium]
MFSDELKQGTAVAHMDLERKMIPHLKKIGSKMDYVRLLNYLLRFYHPLEERLTPYLDGYPLQSHAGNILNDIRDMDPGYREPAQWASHLPVIDSSAKALGVLYVLEGSTLGGQVITKMLTKQLEGTGVAAFRFYNPYDNDTMPQWKLFKERINQPLTSSQQQAVIAGANETFNSLNRWISLYE